MLNKLWYIELYISKHGYMEVFLRSHAIEINVNYLSYMEFLNQVIKISWIFSVSWSTLRNQLISWQTYTIHIWNTVSLLSIGAIVSSIALSCKHTRCKNKLCYINGLDGYSLSMEVFAQVPWTSIYPSFTVFSHLRRLWVIIRPFVVPCSHVSWMPLRQLTRVAIETCLNYN